MKPLLIIGAGGFGREVAWLVERINKNHMQWDLLGFIDDNVLVGTDINGYPVLSNVASLVQYNKKVYIICAIGNAQVRKKVINEIEVNDNIDFATLIDPSVILSDKVRIGKGVIICAGCIITVNISIGKHVIINLDCTVGHDVDIDNYVTIYPSVNVSGITQIGECTEIGSGAAIIQGKTIIKNIIVGAGSVVIKDLLEEGVYVGAPARRINK